MTNTTAPSVPTNPITWRPVAEVTSALLRPGDTLLAIWAHPDDESYLGAGLMAGAARLGVRVVSISVTLGEHGTDDPVSFPPAKLAALREQELRGALGALGARSVAVLGYEDGECHEVPEEVGTEHIGRVVDAVRPDAVLTFDSDGVTGHADHQAVGRWTRGALAERGDVTPLVTTVVGSVWPVDLIDQMHSVSMFYPGYPLPRPAGPFVPVTLSGDVLEQKLSALREHRSQVGPLETALGVGGYRRMAAIEAYRPTNEAATRLLADLTVTSPSEEMATAA